MSITRVGMTQTIRYGTGWDAIFGGTSSIHAAKKAATKAKPKSSPAKKAASKAKPKKKK